MPSGDDVAITLLQPEDHDEARDLILDGLAEHFGALDPDKNLDLNDIGSSYANAVFLVAKCGGRIVGTGALVPRGEGVAEIVRMSVASDLRRQGLGTMILRQLCKRAKAEDYPRVILETTETWTDVIEFYRRFGFQVTHHQEGNVYFVLDLP